MTVIFASFGERRYPHGPLDPVVIPKPGLPRGGGCHLPARESPMASALPRTK